MLFFASLGEVMAQQWVSGTCTMGIASNTYGPNTITTANATSRHAVIYSQNVNCLSGLTLNTIYLSRYSATAALSGTPNLKIYIKETTAADWGTTALDWATAITGATLVYDADPTSIIGTTTGYKAFPLSTTFTPSGQNLAVFFQYTNSSASTGSAGWEYEYTSPCVNTANSNTTKYITNTTGTPGASLSSTNYRRPVIGFDYTGTSTAVPAVGTVQSSTAAVTGGTVNNQIMHVTVNPCSATTVTSLSFDTNGSTSASDITAAKVYYTSTSTFATTTLFGSATNPNGPFTITGSQSVSGNSTGYFWLTYDLACGAIGGNVVDASSTQVIAGANTTIPSTPNPTGTRTITAASTTITTTQPSTANATAGSIDIQILRVQVTSCANSIVTDLNLSTTGSTNPATDIAQAKVYFTTSTTFATTTQFGSTVSAPNGAFTVSGSQALASGTGYFWLVYDLPSTATNSNVLDASCTSVIQDGVTFTPTTPNPAGTRTIVTPPSNDRPENAIDITSNINTACSSAPYTTLNAGVQAGEPSPVTANGGDWGTAISSTTWLKFVASSSTMKVTSGLGTNTDTQIAVYEASDPTNFSTFVLVGSDDDASAGLASEVTLTGLTVGSTYYIQTDGYSTATGTYCITVRDNAISLPAQISCTTFASNTANVCNNGASVSGVTGSKWYTFTDESTSNDRTLILGLNPNGNNLGIVTVKEQTGSSAAAWLGGLTAMARVYSIKPATTPSSPVTIRLFFLNTEMATYNGTATINDLVINKQTVALEDCNLTNNPAAEIIVPTRTQVTPTVFMLEFPVSSFSEFAVTTAAAPLPVAVTTFAAHPLDKSNMIEWATATERNTQWHIVERSKDGYSNWEMVGKLQAAGNSTEENEYALEDKSPLAVSYYRLRSVDFDGHEDRSDIVIVSRKTGGFGVTAAYPSPTSDLVNVQFESVEEADLMVRVSDLSGRIVVEQSLVAYKGINQTQLDLTNLASGAYMIQVINGTTVSAPYKVVKQ